MSADLAASPNRRAASWLLALLFFALLVPDLFDITHYHGDERFYTDAAISMANSGELLTPRYPDGRMRFEKPIASYLALVGSYSAFGVSLFSSRLPFLVAGALVVAATAWAGRRLLGDGDAALLAAAIVASCPDFLTLSVRSTPDIFLCLFLLLGLTGFALLLRAPGPDVRGAHAAAWLGSGLAIATKGGLGAVLLAYALAFAAGSRLGLQRLRRLWHPVYVPLGLVLAASGFGVYALQHGATALESPLRDQVVGRVLKRGAFLDLFGSYLVIPFEHLAPWILLILAGAWRDPAALRALRERHGNVLAFALGWLGVLLVMFSFGSNVRGRYLAPAYPLLAVVLAAGLATLARRGHAEPLLRRSCLVLVGLVGAAGVVLGVGGARIDGRLVVAGFVTATLAAAAIAATRRAGPLAPALALGVTLLVAQTLGESALRRAFSRTPVPELAARLLAPDLAGFRVAQIGESAHLASKLRMATGGRVAIDGYRRGGALPDWSRYDAFVTDGPPPDAVLALGVRVEPCGESWGDDWTTSEILDVLRAEDPSGVLARRSRPYFVAVRMAPATP